MRKSLLSSKLSTLNGLLMYLPLSTDLQLKIRWIKVWVFSWPPRYQKQPSWRVFFQSMSVRQVLRHRWRGTVRLRSLTEKFTFARRDGGFALLASSIGLFASYLRLPTEPLFRSSTALEESFGNTKNHRLRRRSPTLRQWRTKASSGLVAGAPPALSLRQTACHFVRPT